MMNKEDVLQRPKVMPEEKLIFRQDQLIQQIQTMLQGEDLSWIKQWQSLLYQKSIRELQEMIHQGQLTYTKLCVYYLYRIMTIDQGGFAYNAVSEINPNALQLAKQCDAHPNTDLPLYGMPILVKENINTKDMPTSAGSYALRDFIPSQDAPIIEQLKKAGAIILGKTNLSEMAYYMSTIAPSGYSSKKGQTLNPFGPLKISPLGSSSGSGVAMALDLAAATLGSETTGSIVAPASINSVVGYKPSHAILDGRGVLPISYDLDTLGPITKNVDDAILMVSQLSSAISYEEQPFSWQGKVIGMVQVEQDDAFYQAIQEELMKLGASVKVVDVNMEHIHNDQLMEQIFQHDFDDYVQQYQAPIQSLKQLVEYNRQHPEVACRYGQDLLENALVDHGPYQKEMIPNAKAYLKQLKEQTKVDVFVSKGHDGAEIACCIHGPEVCVPAMMKKEPIGITFFGLENEDQLVLQFAKAYEKQTNHRLYPTIHE